GQLAFVVGDDELAASRVRYLVLGAELVQEAASFDAQTGLQGAGRVVHAAVNHAAVVGAGVETRPRVALENADRVTPAGDGPCRRQAGDAGADDGDVDVFLGHAPDRLTSITVTSYNSKTCARSSRMGPRHSWPNER